MTTVQHIVSALALRVAVGGDHPGPRDYRRLCLRSTQLRYGQGSDGQCLGDAPGTYECCCRGGAARAGLCDHH